MAKDLTARQREIFNYIKDMILERGRPPSIREIGERFGIRSTNGVRAVLEALERKGYVRRDRYTSRGIELLKEADDTVPSSRLREISWVGRVAAGTPIWAEQNIEGSFYIDKDFVSGEEVFSLKVQGDSMIEAGIFDGDFVLVKRQQSANKVRLEAANPGYGPIVVDKNTPGFSIAGKVIGLLRRM
jgi:repressor LexA